MFWGNLALQRVADDFHSLGHFVIQGAKWIARTFIQCTQVSQQRKGNARTEGRAILSGPWRTAGFLAQSDEALAADLAHQRLLLRLGGVTPETVA